MFRLLPFSTAVAPPSRLSSLIIHPSPVRYLLRDKIKQMGVDYGIWTRILNSRHRRLFWMRERWSFRPGAFRFQATTMTIERVHWNFRCGGRSSTREYYDDDDSLLLLIGFLLPPPHLFWARFDVDHLDRQTSCLHRITCYIIFQERDRYTTREYQG